jgi:hypothetical protein
MTNHTSDIEKNAKLILDQCQASAGRGLYGYSSTSVNVPAVGMDFSKGAQVEALEQLQFYKLNNEQIELLRALYQAHDDEGKKTLVDLCAKALISADCSAQAFVFLARYNSFRDALKLVTGRPGLFLYLAATALPALAQILRFDHSFIANQDLETLCPQLMDVLEHLRPKGTVEKLGPRRTIRYSAEESPVLRRFEPVEKLVKRLRSGQSCSVPTSQGIDEFRS